MRLLFLVLFFALAISLILLLLFRMNANWMHSKAKKQLMRLDEKYKSFIQKRMTLSIIEKKDLKQEKQLILQEVFTVLKPDIDALIAHIHMTVVPSFRATYSSYTSAYFHNVVSLAEEMFFSKKITTERVVQEQDREKLYQAFRESIEADITQRMLDIKTEVNISS